MQLRLGSIVEALGGDLHGDGGRAIDGLAPLESATATQLAFATGVKYRGQLAASRAGCVIVGPDLREAALARGDAIVTDQPYLYFARVTQLWKRGVDARSRPAVHPSAVVDPGAVIDPTARIGALCIVERGARIGAGTVLKARVTVGEDCVIGARCIVHPGAVIGADGFGYRNQKGKHVKVPQLGWVEIEDDVEVGACATIDRGTFGPTRIGAGTKIDNLVMIGHNCQIGRHNVLCGQVGIAGSCTTGDYVVMAGQVGVADHVEIGARVVVGAQSGVPNDIPADSNVFGYPAGPVNEQRRMLVGLRRLPELRDDVKRIKKHLGLGDSE